MQISGYFPKLARLIIDLGAARVSQDAVLAPLVSLLIEAPGRVLLQGLSRHQYCLLRYLTASQVKEEAGVGLAPNV